MVAVVISNLTNLYYPEVLAEVTRRLSDRGVRVLLFTLAAESDVEAVLDQVWRYRVDGAGLVGAGCRGGGVALGCQSGWLRISGSLKPGSW